jgi:CRP-like cAMP-binding protein
MKSLYIFGWKGYSGFGIAAGVPFALLALMRQRRLTALSWTRTPVILPYAPLRLLEALLEVVDMVISILRILTRSAHGRRAETETWVGREHATHTLANNDHIWQAL